MRDHESALLLYEEAMAFAGSAALRAFARLGVADHVDDDVPVPVTVLAAATGTRTAGLARLLRFLASRGVVRRHDGDQYTLAPLGRALRSSAEPSARSGVLMFTDPMFWTMCHRLESSLTDHEPDFARYFGEPLDDYFARNPETDELFYEGMATVSDAENAIVAAAADLPGSGTIVDVGGRNGSMLLTALQARPGLDGVLFDRPDALDTRRLEEAGQDGRWKAVGGDFFLDVPRGDVLVLKRILHNWDDQDSVRILSSCRRALEPGGRVLVVDAVVPEDGGKHQSHLMDLMMLGAFTGQERTAAELRPLFAAAGLRVTRVVPTSSVMSIVEAVAGAQA
ncbi:methyltransferase [Amycolatopsis rhizosphaerae]|uniref:Methyltransferase n=1 Tax=Amycolatopsis rhizosphaerae TaxID=2053003 RepID=A0A557ZQ88_9PSEU|nr:methyltransferase [Amycolatopsis rhizosphaerae]TVT14158.1 methyltransferase [Amycolatopsis rhizosphaerae]